MLREKNAASNENTRSRSVHMKPQSNWGVKKKNKKVVGGGRQKLGDLKKKDRNGVQQSGEGSNGKNTKGGGPACSFTVVGGAQGVCTFWEGVGFWGGGGEGRRKTP